MLQDARPVRICKAPVDKIRKLGVEEFRATADDDLERAKFWLENTIRVLDEVPCTPVKCLKCAGNMIVSEYEREFVRLSKNASEWVQTEAKMLKRFEEGLNKDIKVLIRILKLREFVVLVERAHKAKELIKEKRQAEREARVTSKKFMNKTQLSTSKKSKNYHERFATSMEYSGKE
ncbi:Gag-Pol polyprotein [Gossypium australe]|uniref:Gag-Pol polyprotein n=1 Tax=Gossypium australe TaxID=47621 RepID=A0A5B6WRT8_9ROSI|nr:Gag-Pol polyprotein [Gossypium australe]